MDGKSHSQLSAAGMAIGALSVAASRWFLAMRDCIGRERLRQSEFREKNGLPKSAKVPYERQPLTESEKTTALMSESVVKEMFGQAPAEYARDKFEHALATGDMRAFKIRLLFIKVRDSLKGTRLYNEFSDLLSDAISEAEEMAGCKPDPSPRRMSRSEQERRAKRESGRIGVQQELPLVWPTRGTTETTSTSSQDIEGACVSSGLDKLAEDNKTQKIARVHTQNMDTSSINEYSEKQCTDEKNNSVLQDIEHDTESNNDLEKSYCNGVVLDDHGKSGGAGVIRKAREYETVDQILEDIESGKIVPYESNEQICEDMKNGVITPVDAFMFTSAMERYEHEEPDFDEELERELTVDFPEEDETIPIRDDEEDDGDDFDEEHEDRRSGSKEPFSYNPNGFYGCAGGYSASGVDWNRDDEW